MKKSTGVILVLIIVLLLGVIGVGGYFFIKGNNDTNKEIGDLKNEVANLGNEIKNTPNSQVINNVQTNNTNTTSTGNQTNNITESEALEIAKSTYEKAYKAVNRLDDEGIFVHGDYTVNGEKIEYKAKTEMLKKYFSESAIKQLFTEYNGEYYPKRRAVDILPGIFGLTDQGIRPLTILNYTNTKISATGQITEGDCDKDSQPLKIEFVKEGNNWLVNYFE